jgi:hypothetical protein
LLVSIVRAVGLLDTRRSARTQGVIRGVANEIVACSTVLVVAHAEPALLLYINSKTMVSVLHHKHNRCIFVAGCGKVTKGKACSMLLS